MVYTYNCSLPSQEKFFMTKENIVDPSEGLKKSFFAKYGKSGKQVIYAVVFLVVAFFIVQSWFDRRASKMREACMEMHQNFQVMHQAFAKGDVKEFQDHAYTFQQSLKDLPSLQPNYEGTLVQQLLACESVPQEKAPPVVEAMGKGVMDRTHALYGSSYGKFAQASLNGKLRNIEEPEGDEDGSDLVEGYARLNQIFFEEKGEDQEKEKQAFAKWFEWKKSHEQSHQKMMEAFGARSLAFTQFLDNRYQLVQTGKS